MDGTQRPARRLGIVLALALAVLGLGVAYFAGGLRPIPPDGPEAAPALETESADGSPTPAPTDSIVSPEDLPGFETAHLTSSQRLWLYHRAHLERCACECGMTVAQCRVEDPTCPESPGRAVELVREAERAVPGP